MFETVPEDDYLTFSIINGNIIYDGKLTYSYAPYFMELPPLQAKLILTSPPVVLLPLLKYCIYYGSTTTILVLQYCVSSVLYRFHLLFTVVLLLQYCFNRSSTSTIQCLPWFYYNITSTVFLLLPCCAYYGSTATLLCLLWFFYNGSPITIPCQQWF